MPSEEALIAIPKRDRPAGAWLRVAFAVIPLGAAIIFRAHAQDTASAERFLRQLYAPYATDAGDEKLPEPEAIYDPELLALVRKDRAMMEKYEKGLLREDPVCVCQDWTALRVLKITVRPTGTDQLDATVLFTDAGERTRLAYQLVSVAGQWRIHDIRGGVAPSLHEFLMDGLAQEGRDVSDGK